MSINLVTYANQTVTPTNDAIIYEKAIDQNGIFYGCNVTVSSNNVNITGGYGIICGREFTVNSESIAVTLAPSGTLLGRLYVRLDLADADAPIQLLTVTGESLPALEQDADVNYTNGTWEMELATFDVGVSALSNVVETFETIYGAKGVLDEVLDTLSIIKGSTFLVREQKVSLDNISISANSYYSGTDIDISKTGYTPIAVAGFRLENATNGGTLNTYCSMHSAKIYTTGLTVIVRNNNTSNAAKIRILVDILYRKSSWT